MLRIKRVLYNFTFYSNNNVIFLVILLTNNEIQSREDLELDKLAGYAIHFK